MAKQEFCGKLSLAACWARILETFMKMLRVTGVMLVGAWLVACSSSQQDWTQATTQNTVAAYQAYLGKHPDSEHAAEARERMGKLADEQAWSQADSANTLQAFQGYLQQQANGAHVAEARDKISIAERKAAWDAAQSAGTAAAYQGFLAKYSQGAEADQARAKLVELNGYTVQLASIHSAAEANKVRDRLKQKYGTVLHDVVVVPPSGTDKSNSVRSAPMSEEEAKSACQTLKKSHQSCEVIKSANS
jgi:hypothetical protein